METTIVLVLSLTTLGIMPLMSRLVYQVASHPYRTMNSPRICPNSFSNSCFDQILSPNVIPGPCFSSPCGVGQCKSLGANYSCTCPKNYYPGVDQNTNVQTCLPSEFSL